MGCVESKEVQERRSLLSEKQPTYGFTQRPILRYFALRGRGEVIRLALEHVGCEYTDTSQSGEVDYNAMKADAGTEQYPFGQLPVLVDDTLVLPQSNAILRHIGRKYNIAGNDDNEKAMVDAILDGVEALRSAYGKLCYEDRFSEEARQEYGSRHLDPATIHERNNGAHFTFLTNIMRRSKTTFIVNDTITIADIAVFDIVDLHKRHAAFPDLMQQHHAPLLNHYRAMASSPNLAKYLGSTRRFQKVNGNGLG